MKKLILIVSIILGSCSSVRLVEIELYKKAMFKDCHTDTECEQAERLVNERLFNCTNYRR